MRGRLGPRGEGGRSDCDICPDSLGTQILFLREFGGRHQGNGSLGACLQKDDW